MKRIMFVLILVFMLCFTLTLTIFAENEMNIAPEATASVSHPRWSIDPSKINDGDRSKGCASNQSVRDFFYYLDFEADRNFSKITVVVNSIGTYPTDGAFTWTEMTNHEFWFEVRVDDSNGNRTYTKGANLTTRDQNENGEVIFDLDNVKGSKITIYIVNNYNNNFGIWEVEAYEHICSYDNIKERIEEETCIKDGLGIYECECGSTMQGVIPALGYHTYKDEAEIKYANGYLQNGEEKHYCKTCDDFQSSVVKPMFEFLGYSSSFDKKSVCAGYAVNTEELEAYELSVGYALSYGAICSTQASTVLLSASGDVLTASTVKQEVSGNTTGRFDIKLRTNDWSRVSDLPFTMCAYVIDGEAVSYLCTKERSTESSILVTYNEIINA